MSLVHIALKCDTALSWVRRNTPATREVDWMSGSRHNKNANRCTEITAFIREKNRFSTSLRSFEYSVLIITEASKNGIGGTSHRWYQH